VFFHQSPEMLKSIYQQFLTQSLIWNTNSCRYNTQTILICSFFRQKNLLVSLSSIWKKKTDLPHIWHIFFVWNLSKLNFPSFCVNTFFFGETTVR
jgi:hypothetical protein